MEQVDSTIERDETTKAAEPDYQDLYLRTLADFDNYRKRIERERHEIGAAGKRDLLVSLLDVVDNFERAAAAAPPSRGAADDAVSAGYLAIYRQLQRLLETNGVERFESAGEPFDPTRMEAISTVPSEEVPADHVAYEARPGYLWNGRLLRAARVVVSTGSAADEEA